MAIAPTNIELPLDPKKPRIGVVAMIDALAFKGIWKRHGFESVIARLQFIREQVEVERARLQTEYPKFSSITKNELQVRFLSDTIVITAHNSSHLWGTRAFLPDGVDKAFYEGIQKSKTQLDQVSQFVALKTVVSVVAYALGAAIAGAKGGELPVINYRGAISFGEYLVDDNFLIGQAVDDCGEYYEAAEAAIVGFHPSALQFWNECQILRDELTPTIIKTGQFTLQDIKNYMCLPEVIPYTVPLKKQPLATAVVNPLSRFRRQEWETIRDLILSQIIASKEADETLVDCIQRKQENTRGFLDAAIASSPAVFPPPAPAIDEAARVLRARTEYR